MYITIKIALHYIFQLKFRENASEKKAIYNRECRSGWRVGERVADEDVKVKGRKEIKEIYTWWIKHRYQTVNTVVV